MERMVLLPVLSAGAEGKEPPIRPPDMAAEAESGAQVKTDVKSAVVMIVMAVIECFCFMLMLLLLLLF